jgi:pyridoxal phosphate enzyme (YggS family)
MTTSKHLDQNFKIFLQSIENYRKKYNHSKHNFKIVAVSKSVTAEQILELYNLGQLDFAENYLNEALPKITAINNINSEYNKNLSSTINKANIMWHYIGKIQSNKAKLIAQNFTWVHSVDSLKIAEKLNAHRLEHLGKLNILIQVNLQNDHNKSGITPNDVFALTNSIITSMPHLQLRGLMCILNLESQTFEQQFVAFNNLKKCLISLNQHYNLQLDTLSMGMSGDYEAAIAAGSTMLRIGSAIFGTRNKQ